MTDSANVQLVRAIYADWERGDYSATEWADPEIELVIADGPSPGTWTGLARMAEVFRELVNAWDEIRTEAEKYRELDDERVLVLTRWSGRGRTSGLEVGHVRPKGAHLFYVRGGMVTRYVFYFDRDRALADLGLASEADSP